MDGIANGCVRFCSHLRDVLLLFTMFVVSDMHASSRELSCLHSAKWFKYSRRLLVSIRTSIHDVWDEVGIMIWAKHLKTEIKTEPEQTDDENEPPAAEEPEKNIAHTTAGRKRSGGRSEGDEAKRGRIYDDDAMKRQLADLQKQVEELEREMCQAEEEQDADAAQHEEQDADAAQHGEDEPLRLNLPEDDEEDEPQEDDEEAEKVPVRFKLCRFHATIGCTNDSCRFNRSRKHWIQSDGDGYFCKFWFGAGRWCAKGDKCTFLHDFLVEDEYCWDESNRWDDKNRSSMEMVGVEKAEKTDAHPSHDDQSSCEGHDDIVLPWRHPHLDHKKRKQRWWPCQHPSCRYNVSVSFVVDKGFCCKRCGDSFRKKEQSSHGQKCEHIVYAAVPADASAPASVETETRQYEYKEQVWEAPARGFKHPTPPPPPRREKQSSSNKTHTTVSAYRERVALGLNEEAAPAAEEEEEQKKTKNKPTPPPEPPRLKHLPFWVNKYNIWHCTLCNVQDANGKHKDGQSHKKKVRQWLLGKKMQRKTIN